MQTALRNPLSMILAGLLIAQLIPAQQPPATGEGIKQTIAALPPKARVELELADGTAVRGRIVSRADVDFGFRQDKAGSTQNISYSQVRSVSQLKATTSNKKWIIIGAVAGAAVVVAIIAVVAVKHPLGSGTKF